MKNNIKIAIDGLSASGKSSLARYVARMLDISYLDTGSMYRAFSMMILEDGYEVDKIKNNVELLSSYFKNFNYEYVNGDVYLNGKNITSFLYEDRINSNVSKVSQIPYVRKSMIELQQTIGKNKSIVMDGRDIGTAVLPDAQFKFYITASSEIRAIRRLNQFEFENNGFIDEINKIKKALDERDYLDTKLESSPMKNLAHDVVEIDNSNLSLEETADIIIKMVKDYEDLK